MTATPTSTTLRERFARGDALTGIIDFIGAPMVIEILASAGIDFVIIDMEHCPMDMDRLAHLVRAADDVDRVPRHDGRRGADNRRGEKSSRHCPGKVR